MSVHETMQNLMQMPGAVAAAIIDYENAMVLVSDSKRDDFEMEIWDIVAADATNIIGAIDQVMRLMEVNDEVISVLFTMKDEYHMVYPTRRVPNTIIYMIADRSEANLSISRNYLSRAAKTFGEF